MTREQKRLYWLDRCDVCGWPVEEDRAAGCHEFDCSMRPLPMGKGLSHEERLRTRDYIRQLERRLRVLENSNDS